MSVNLFILRTSGIIQTIIMRSESLSVCERLHEKLETWSLSTTD